MRALLVITLSAALALPAAALAADTVNFGMRVVSVGDSIGKVYDVAGEPSRVVQLENKFGAAAGERLEYYQGSKTVQLTVREGRVVKIDEVR